MYTLPDTSVQEIIAALEVDAILFPAGMLLHLDTTDFTPTRATVLGDFTELTNIQVPGYVAAAPAWNGTPLRKADGSWEDLMALVSFIAAGGPPPVGITVYNWFLTDVAGTVLVASGRLSNPFTFVADGDGFTLEGVLNVLDVDDENYTVHLDFEME